jgi:hypothetical protein
LIIVTRLLPKLANYLQFLPGSGGRQLARVLQIAIANREELDGVRSNQTPPGRMQ